MRTGISLNTATADARAVVAAARAAEEAGFDAVWCYDHLSGTLLGGDGALEVWSTLGAIATATETVRLGPLVLNTTTRHPARISAGAATVQSLSGGRLQLGLGAGASRPSPYAEELDMFALPHHRAAARRERVRDTIGFLRALWAGEASFPPSGAPGDSGVMGPIAFGAVTGVSRPDPLPPLIVGANGPKMVEVAAAHADGVNLHFWEPDLPALVQRARHLAAAAGNEGFRVSVEGPWEPAWIDPASPTRTALAEAGVDEVMVAWRADAGLGAIGEAAALLR